MTPLDFIELHALGALCAVVIGVAAAWVFADRGGF